MTWNTFPLALDWTRDITPGVRHFAFRRADAEPLEYTAGQFINLHFDREDGRTHRSYSVATPPGESGLIEIAVAPIEGGLATGVLWGMGEGDMIDASGPFGRFVLRDDPPCRYVLVATGTGVTPYRAMLPALTRLLEKGSHEVELLLGVRGPGELLYGDEFEAMAEAHPGFRFTACYSRTMPEAPRGFETRGYVQDRFEALALDPSRDIVYLCGNPAMVDDAYGALKAAGFGVREVRREKYLSART